MQLAPSPCQDDPRARVLDGGVSQCSDAELLAVVLGTGTRGLPVGQLALRLLERSGGLAGLARSIPEEVTALEGLGPARAARLMGALEMGRRLASRRSPAGEAVRCGRDIAALFTPGLEELEVEQFHAVLLDAKNRVRRSCLVSQGSLTASLVHPREVFRAAVRAGAAGLVVVHNHPSGDPEPSVEDRRLTQRLAEAGRVLGIPLLDHVVVGRDGYVSFVDRGWMEQSTERSGAASRELVR